jgi:hypothetical protein
MDTLLVPSLLSWTCPVAGYGLYLSNGKSDTRIISPYFQMSSALPLRVFPKKIRQEVEAPQKVGL